MKPDPTRDHRKRARRDPHALRSIDQLIAALKPLPEDFLRVPGLFRRWELQDVIDPAFDFHVEAAGETSDGTTLFQVWRRPLPPVVAPTDAVQGAAR